MARECSEEEKTRTYTNEEGTEKEIYIPKEDVPAEDLFKIGISAGINFARYESIPVEVTGENKVSKIERFEDAGLRPLLLGNIKKCSYNVPTPIQKHTIPILMVSLRNIEELKRNWSSYNSCLQVKEGKKITGPEQLKDAAFGCARIRGDTLGIVGLGKFKTARLLLMD